MVRQSTTFVGRAAELATLRAALVRATSGASSLVIVSGESGIGKSRLLDHFAGEAKRGLSAGEAKRGLSAGDAKRGLSAGEAKRGLRAGDAKEGLSAGQAEPSSAGAADGGGTGEVTRGADEAKPGVSSGVANQGVIAATAKPSSTGAEPIRRITNLRPRTRTGTRTADGSDRSGQPPLVLRGWCVPAVGAGFAFGPVAMLLREALRLAPELAEVVADRAADVIHLLPDGVVDARPPVSASGELGQLRLLEACRVVLTEAAKTRAVVAIVEDLHWADRSSTDALSYISGRAQPPGLMLVVSYRTEDLPRHHHVHPIIREMERGAHAESLVLAPFGTVELRAQLKELLGAEPTEDLVQDLADRSGGNPFFVEELIAAGANAGTASIPQGLADLLISRVEPLPRDLQRLLRVAAAIGRQVHPDILASSLDADADEVAAGVRTAVESGILVAVDERLEFRHELLREAVYATLLPGERKPLHAAVARALAAHPELATTNWCLGELAYHWQLAGDARAALTTAVQAATEAREAGAVAAAARYGARALELWDSVADAEALVGTDRIELLMRIADDSLLGGGIPAHTWAAKALELVDADDDPARHSLVAVRLANFELMAGQPSRALVTAAAATRVMASQPDSVDKARVAAQHAQILMFCDQYDESRDLSYAARELAHELEDPIVEVVAGSIHGVALVTLGDWKMGLVALDGASLLARRLGDQDGAAEARARAAMAESFCLYWLGFPDKGYRVARAGYEAASRSGLELSLGFALRSCAAAMAVAAGELDTAEALLTDVSPSLVQRFSRFLAEARASLAMARGEFDQADDALIGVESSPVAPVGLYNLGPIEVALAQHRPDAARSIVADLLEAALRLKLTWKVAPLAALGTAAEVETAAECRVRGDVDGVALAQKRAEALVVACARTSEEIMAVAGELPPSVLGWTAMAEARMADIAGEPSPAAWRAAAKICVAAGFPLLVLQCRLEAARACLATGDREAAAGELAALVDEATRAGVEHQAAAARALADRAGIRLGRKPGSDARTTRERLGLTDREIQVLGLAAEGMTNREIGTALFLSPKTVSVHITNVLRKLDVPSRRDAARLARGLGLV